LWLNSTLGLIMLLAHREETRGAWVDFKKPVLGQLPVIDLNALSTQQLKHLSASYDGIVNHALRLLPKMANNDVEYELIKLFQMHWGCQTARHYGKCLPANLLSVSSGYCIARTILAPAGPTFSLQLHRLDTLALPCTP
jgi:hypothetical protein